MMVADSELAKVVLKVQNFTSTTGEKEKVSDKLSDLLGVRFEKV